METVEKRIVTPELREKWRVRRKYFREKNPEKVRIAKQKSYLKYAEKYREKSKLWRQTHPGKSKEYNVKARLNRKKFKLEIDKIKESTPCKDCGRYYPAYVMDFDHRDPTLKHNCVARMIQSCGHDKVMNEIEKCDLVCANCHRIRTHKKCEDRV